MSAEASPAQGPVVALRPRLAASFGAILGAAFFGIVAWAALAAGSWRHAWWMVLPAWGIRETIRHGEATIRRFQVTGVRKCKDLHFKGIRVDGG